MLSKFVTQMESSALTVRSFEGLSFSHEVTTMRSGHTQTTVHMSHDWPHLCHGLVWSSPVYCFVLRSGLAHKRGTRNRTDSETEMGCWRGLRSGWCPCVLPIWPPTLLRMAQAQWQKEEKTKLEWWGMGDVIVHFCTGKVDTRFVLFLKRIA